MLNDNSPVGTFTAPCVVVTVTTPAPGRRRLAQATALLVRFVAFGGGGGGSLSTLQSTIVGSNIAGLLVVGAAGFIAGGGAPPLQPAAAPQVDVSATVGVLVGCIGGALCVAFALAVWVVRKRARREWRNKHFTPPPFSPPLFPGGADHRVTRSEGLFRIAAWNELQ